MFNLPLSVSVALIAALIIAVWFGLLVLIGHSVRRLGWDEPTIPRSQVVPFRPLPHPIDRKKKYLVLVSRAKHTGLSREERS